MLAWALAVGMVTSCATTTTESPGSAKVTGTIESSAFTFGSGFAQVVPRPGVSCQEHGGDGGRTECQLVAIILTTRTDLTCDVLTSSQAADQLVKYANQDDLAITVLVNSGTVPPGPYNASGTYETSSATCGSGVVLESSDGSSFTLTQLNATEVAGSFTMNFGASGSLSGSFDVPICSSLPSDNQPDANVTCVP